MQAYFDSLRFIVKDLVARPTPHHLNGNNYRKATTPSMFLTSRVRVRLALNQIHASPGFRGDRKLSRPIPVNLQPELGFRLHSNHRTAHPLLRQVHVAVTDNILELCTLLCGLSGDPAGNCPYTFTERREQRFCAKIADLLECG